MKKSRYSETQIIKVLKEVEAGRQVKDVCREYSAYSGEVDQPFCLMLITQASRRLSQNVITLGDHLH